MGEEELWRPDPFVSGKLWKVVVGSLSPPTFCLSFTLLFKGIVWAEEKRSNRQQDLKLKPVASQSCLGGCGWDLNLWSAESACAQDSGIWDSEEGGFCIPAQGICLMGPRARTSSSPELVSVCLLICLTPFLML